LQFRVEGDWGEVSRIKYRMGDTKPVELYVKE